jgi:hypothetical protein
MQEFLMIDYRELLKKYLKLVGKRTGVYYFGGSVDFTEKELEHLYKLVEEIDEEGK